MASISIFPKSIVKGIDIRDGDILITLDKDDEIINDILYCVNEGTNLPKNTLDYIAKNLSELINHQKFMKFCWLLIKNGYKIELREDDILEVINKTSFIPLIEFYNILKHANLLNEKYEEMIANRLAFIIKKSYEWSSIKGFKSEWEEELKEGTETNRELVEKAVKLSAQSFVREAIEDIPIWLRRPAHAGAFSYFLIFIRVLKDLEIESIVKEEIELLKNELKKYKNRIRRVMKNRIKREEREDELKTLISILEDRSLYKYLL